MMIENDVHIDAPVDRVWQLTIDVEQWPRLSPTTMTSVTRLDSGPIRLGSTARVVQPRQRPTVWTVTAFEPNQLFVWRATVFGVAMTASHILRPTATGCTNLLRIETSGFGARLLERLAGRKIREAITVENIGFKEAAEAAASTVS